MHGVKRVIAFCILTAILPASLIILPLYLRHTVFADVVYPIAESDIIEIRDGISSIFCQRHTLQMNTSFNAFQLKQKPEISQNRKHIRLKKSMSLPDDTLEYWGFYLLKGATVALKVCSRYDGSRILVVKGERNLRTCGLLEHNKNKIGAHLNNEHTQVLVTFESAAEIVDSSGPNNDNKSDRYVPPDIGNHGGEDLTDEDMTADETLNAHRKSEESTKHAYNTKHKLASKGLVANNQHRKKSNENPDSSDEDKSLAHQDRSAADGRPSNVPNSIHISKEVDSSRRHYDSFKQQPEATSAKTTQNTNREIEEVNRRKRHHGRHGHHRDKIIRNSIHAEGTPLAENIPTDSSGTRTKRDTVYDRRINHGGNAFNFSNNTSDSVSSFENSLLTCYDGDILLAQSFPPSHLCKDVQYLENGVHMVTKHEIASDGYYYYIFYSDNDYVQNDIHAVFDIYKPTFQYSNISESKGCVNSTNCSFPISFWTDERVIVEVPTRDGIEHEEDDITFLISTCQPRMAIYVIFPISVLFLVLTCAFL
ncbi:uncharacterized protein LOC128742308 [Sabethes cyaneus]|uniref:uncharacterized protein LOC128742308 n=1 Tax=Sabethes cyaneus TaxID=53552 RepID=UPI00237E2ADA|nr:uncharacterized protein LOC128742308 [Sabethes cyaneus]XP_053694613.1 uncharacterized protein LOC128742308 [Sabethes cyaneus]